MSLAIVCSRGYKTRSSMASVVLDNLAAGQSPDEIVQLYPTLRREDVTAVMAYAAELARERVVLTSAA